jgi:hypothetical protein
MLVMQMALTVVKPVSAAVSKLAAAGHVARHSLPPHPDRPAGRPRTVANCAAARETPVRAVPA